MAFKLPYIGRSIKYYTVPLFLGVWGDFGSPADGLTIKMDSIFIEKVEGHLVYFGEILEERSLIRETDRDQPPLRIYVSVHKGWTACVSTFSHGACLLKHRQSTLCVRLHILIN